MSACQKAQEDLAWKQSPAERDDKKERQAIEKNPLDETGPINQSCEAKDWKTKRLESHLECWVLWMRPRRGTLGWRNHRGKEGKLMPSLSGSFIAILNVFLVSWACKLSKSSVDFFMSKHLTSSSSVFVVFSLIMEFTCWINTQTKSYSFCSSTY